MKSFFLSRVFVALFGVGTTLGASLTVSNLAGVAPVRLIDWEGPNYAEDVRGFLPVAPTLLKELTPAPSPVRSSGPAPAATAAATPVPDVSPDPVPSPQPGEPAPTPEPDPAPGLAVAMSADKKNTHPNDTILFTIRVTNAGPGTANGIVIQSHVPDGTTLSGVQCDAPAGDECSRGSSDHALVFTLSELEPGKEAVVRFWVKVDRGLRHNTAITTHAHAHAANADLIDSEQVTVIV